MVRCTTGSNRHKPGRALPGGPTRQRRIYSGATPRWGKSSAIMYNIEIKISRYRTGPSGVAARHPALFRHFAEACDCLIQYPTPRSALLIRFSLFVPKRGSSHMTQRRRERRFEPPVPPTVLRPFLSDPRLFARAAPGRGTEMNPLPPPRSRIIYRKNYRPAQSVVKREELAFAGLRANSRCRPLRAIPDHHQRMVGSAESGRLNFKQDPAPKSPTSIKIPKYQYVVV